MATVVALGGVQTGTRLGSPRDTGTPSPRQTALVPREEGKVELPEIRTSDGAMDKTKPLPTSLQSDFIPEDILALLAQPVPPSEKLGPPSRYRNLNTTTGPARRTPANVWNFPKRREKYKHLTGNTPCLCGAGKDMSFLYDVPKKEQKPENPSSQDKSGERVRRDPDDQPKALSLPDTLVPEEYHVVKNKGVMGLEYHEEKFATHPEDHEKHLVQFPSMNPTSRFEVQMLKEALETMLCKAGVNEEDLELRGPTQMHNLLELIKKEQNIYNIIFHELIRQVSVECLDRGELLSELRNKYSDLLNKVPRQIRGLHEEVLAQRALDRRLTEELMRFKGTIGHLTSELTAVKEHDMVVTKQAGQAQDDLKCALLESQKNASLLSEYHDLYELQRKRLETQVQALSEEREVWSTAAYSLALKVMEEHSLNNAKRLHVSEKSWTKVGNHFTILLSDKDTEVLTKLQGYADKWRDLVEEFHTNLREREADMRDNLTKVKNGMQSWASEFERTLMSEDGYLKHPPDVTTITSLCADVKSWEQTLSQESEKFGGDTVLTGQEYSDSIKQQIYGWTDHALKIFSRHRTESGHDHPDQAQMLALNNEIDKLMGQFSVRLTGENGVATGIIQINNALEVWDSKLSTMLHGANPLPDQEWLRLYQMFDDWATSLDDTAAIVGSTQKEDSRNEDQAHIHIEVTEVMRMTQKWLSSTTNSIDSEDAKLVETVSNLHTDMVQWMVQMLLRLAPDREDHSEEAKAAVLLGSATIGQLQANAKTIFHRLHNFTKYVTECCKTIVTEDMQRKLDMRMENADIEYNSLQKFRTECEEWMAVAKLMLTELTGEVFTVTPMPSSSDMLDTQVTTPGVASQPPHSPGVISQPPLSPGVVFHDQEKLEKAESAQQRVSPDTESTQAQGATEGTPDQPEDRSPDRDSGAAQQTEGQEMEGVAAQETGDEGQQTSEAQVEPATDKPQPQELEVIGYDANTHRHQLEQDPNTAPPHQDKAKMVKREAPDTPDTKRAYEALAAVESLQDQLLNTEERAQDAEHSFAVTEAKLKIAQEKIRALERKYGPLDEEEEEEKKNQHPPEKPKSAASTKTTDTSADAKKDSEKTQTEKIKLKSKTSKTKRK